MRPPLDTTGKRPSPHGRRCIGPWTRPSVGSGGFAERAQHIGHDRQPESPPAALPGASCTAHQHTGHDRHSAYAARPTMRPPLDTTAKRPSPHGRRCIGPWTRPTVGSGGFAERAQHIGHDRQPEQMMHEAPASAAGGDSGVQGPRRRPPRLVEATARPGHGLSASPPLPPLRLFRLSASPPLRLSASPPLRLSASPPLRRGNSGCRSCPVCCASSAKPPEPTVGRVQGPIHRRPSGLGRLPVVLKGGRIVGQAA